MLDEVLKIQEGVISLNFHSYGLNWSGTIHTLRQILDIRPPILEEDRLLHKGYTLHGRHISFIFDKIEYQNEYVELRWLNRDGIYVFMKRLKNMNSTDLYQEAILHILAYHCLKKFNLNNIIPKIYDILEYNNEIVFTMEAFPKARSFSDFLLNNFSPFGTHSFIEVLAQIALYMIPLQNILFFNHRDLKSDNILIENEPAIQVLKFGNKIYTVKTHVRAILIDFGFGCIGFEMGGTSILNAGSALPPMDACPKDGRDIFQILTSLYSFKLFRDTLNQPLYTLFNKWINSAGIKYTTAAIQNSQDKEWIYSITSSSFFSAPGCSPAAILADIAEKYPDIVTIAE